MREHVWIVLNHNCHEWVIDGVFGSVEAAENYIDEINMRDPMMGADLEVECYVVRRQPTEK